MSISKSGIILPASAGPASAVSGSRADFARLLSEDRPSPRPTGASPPPEPVKNIGSTPRPAAPVGKKLRAAAYCRVSTDEFVQESSMENQREHFLRVILSHPEWELVGIYWESNLTATRKENRPQLQQLLRDCSEGKIDLVLTKSISRFSRNTIDCLEMVRSLTALGVDLYFEKENIRTGTEESELLLTLFSSFAEEESRSISRNCSWAVLQRFRDGSYRYSKAPYGYSLRNGRLVVNRRQAEVVCGIFMSVLAGKGTPVIARELNARRVPTGTRRRDGSRGVWSAQMVQGIIKNISYTGDVLLQKSFHDENFHLLRNYGEKTQYYIDGHHTAIIDHETFRLANMASRQRGAEKANLPREDQSLRDNPHTQRYMLSGRLRCARCGTTMRRITDRSVSGDVRIFWACRTHLQDRRKCTMIRVWEEDLKSAFLTMMNKLAFLRPALSGAVGPDWGNEPLRAVLNIWGNDRYREFSESVFEAIVRGVTVETGVEATFYFQNGWSLSEALSRSDADS